jgi:DnaJ family protein C protein 9
LTRIADKAAEADKEDAKKQFQEIAFAYAVLSDDRRRKRYDLTGSTAETLEDDDDFNWLNFYREQFENVVSEEAINRIANEYKGSEEEREDLRNAYNKGKGNLNVVYELVMLSDLLEDDDRFRNILDEEIANGNIESFPAYARETSATRQKAKDVEKKRREDYDKREAKKAAKEAANGKSNGKAKPKGKTGGTDDMAGLAALIQQRQKARSGGFFDALEAKYAPTSRGSKRGTPMDMDEPPEELFEANRAKKPKRSTRAKKPKEEPEDIDMGEEDIADSEEEEAPRKTKARGKAKGRGKASAKS